MRRFLLGGLLLVVSSVFAFSGKNPADYPVKVHILQQNWALHNPNHGEYRGTGRGNVWEGDSIRGFDFRYDCSIALTRTARNQPYKAKWSKPQLRLTILAENIGKENSYSECTLETTVREGVYMLGAGGITEMPQAEFKAWRANRDAAIAARRNGEADTKTQSKLLIESTPDGAEIEVDGEFTGNTPSTLSVTAGEHSITVKKPGFKTWEKKFKVAAGEIKLKADLEPDAGK